MSQINEKRNKKKHKPKKNMTNVDKSTENVDATKPTPSPKKRKTKKHDQDNDEDVPNKRGVSFSSDTIDNEVEAEESPKKKSKKELRLPTSEELSECDKPENVKNVASKRQQKKEKYEKLLASNKIKSETMMQQKALNYLSLWKHNRAEWKFEKLRQVWLQNHMFDSVSVPDEFWDTVVEYFGGAKGQIRKVLIDTCVKVVEESEKPTEAEDDNTETDETKYTRARYLLQFLQE